MSHRNILRFATAGSVDDGKSSLIGRLLYDSKSILEDQMLAIEHASRQRGSGEVELALLTDGLRAEREQNITIDVAYRYFATANRKFIIADTPGHLQYTRNMVTGASTVDLSVILIDARKGVLNQSRRHAVISSLLGIKHLVVAVNKMDLVGFRETTFCEIVREFGGFTRKLGFPDVTFIPISALLGDNIVEASANTPWYDGPTLLHHLEQVDATKILPSHLRLPVQYVIRPHQYFRGFAGRLESGSVKVGDTVQVASSGLQAVVTTIRVSGVEASEAAAGQSVAISLDREIDVSRGDLFHSPAEVPPHGSRFEALVCWMHEQPLELGKRYVVLHTTRRVSAVVEAVDHRLDIDSLDSLDASSLGLNDVGKIVLKTASPLFFDRYSEVPGTGSFVLVDPNTNATVAGGMLQGLADRGTETHHSEHGEAIWLDGFVAHTSELATRLRNFGYPVVLIQESDGVSAADLDEWVPRLQHQGFNVLIAGFESSSDSNIVIRLASVSNVEAAIEEILNRFRVGARRASLTQSLGPQR